METLHLLRYETDAHATHGVLVAPGLAPIATLERPWLDDQLYVSCLRAGDYPLPIHDSPRFGRCLLLRHTAPRSHILIHAGNRVRDTEGCILVGAWRSLLKGEAAVLRSRRARDRLLAWHEQAISVTISIRWALDDGAGDPPVDAETLRLWKARLPGRAGAV